jgi:hypothetical protein
VQVSNIHTPALQLHVVPGSTIAEPSSITSTKISTDASWVQLEKQENSPRPAGLGICIEVKGDQQCSQLFILAITPLVSSVLQAEAFRLLLAMNLADILLLEEVTLAKAATNHNIQDASGYWEIRPQLVIVFNSSSFNYDRIYHIPRSLNFKDDHYASIALRIHNRTFSFR